MEHLTLILSGVLVLAFFVSIYFLQKAAKKANVTAGELLGDIFLKQNHTIVYFALIALTFAELLLVMNLHPADGYEANPFTRMMQHAAPSIIGIIFGLNAPTMLLDFFFNLPERIKEMRTKENGKFSWKFFMLGLLLFLSDGFMMLFSAFILFAMPLMNGWLISKCIGVLKTTKGDFYATTLYEDFFFFDTLNFKLLNSMPLLQATAIFVIFIHLTLSLYEGISIGRRRLMLTLDKEKVDAAKKAAVVIQNNALAANLPPAMPPAKVVYNHDFSKKYDVKDNIIKILSFYFDGKEMDNNSIDAFSAKAKAHHLAYLQDNAANQKVLASHNSVISAILAEMDSFTKTRNKQQEDAVKIKIKTMIASPIQNGGLNFPIPEEALGK